MKSCGCLYTIQLTVTSAQKAHQSNEKMPSLPEGKSAPDYRPTSTASLWSTHSTSVLSKHLTIWSLFSKLIMKRCRTVKLAFALKIRACDNQINTIHSFLMK